MKLINLSKNLLSGGYRLFAVIIVCTLFQSGVLSQETVTGLVRDGATGKSFAGVSVSIKGSRTGVLTDLEGKFSIEVPSKSSVLVFSYIGYETVEITVADKKHLVVDMFASVMQLEEVVTVGYSTNRTRHSKIRGVAFVSDMDVRMPSPIHYNPGVESYSSINETGFRHSLANPLSTFSIDVNTAAYTNVRRFINNGQMPPADAVRIEEMLNYFTYEYAQSVDGHPFSVSSEYSDCPWEPKHKLLHIGLKGKEIPLEELPPSNLVFLIDVSGSMSSANRLPLVKSGFKMLVNKLRSVDNVAIVVYSGAAGCVLPSTPGNEKQKIIAAIDKLEAGGSTAGGAGIQLAYQIAVKNFIPNGNNRVILATDGDFNVGISNEDELQKFIEEKRKTGVYLTCLGFGMGNYKDSKMEILANKGNGNYAYIDNLQEVHKVFIKEFGGTLFTIAKDVKLQIDFNPAKVQSYRLIGYENRRLNNEDFKDDTKDAGEMGAGHTVTAVYEIIPSGVESRFLTDPDPSKYLKQNLPEIRNESSEIATIRVRYKQPAGDQSREFRQVVGDSRLAFNRTSDNFRFSASVAMFGMLLRNSDYKGNATYDLVSSMAEKARGSDDDGYRAEFIRMVKSVRDLDGLTQR
jgi:Ca-activated chloride channel homolog